MYKNIKLLFVNSILFLLTIVLMNYIFQNYAIFEKIKMNLLFANKFLHHLQIKKTSFVYFFLNNISRRNHEKNSKNEFIQ